MKTTPCLKVLDRFRLPNALGKLPDAAESPLDGV
jgi:hypothetical protein